MQVLIKGYVVALLKNNYAQLLRELNKSKAKYHIDPETLEARLSLSNDINNLEEFFSSLQKISMNSSFCKVKVYLLVKLLSKKSIQKVTKSLKYKCNQHLFTRRSIECLMKVNKTLFYVRFNLKRPILKAFILTNHSITHIHGLRLEPLFINCAEVNDAQLIHAFKLLLTFLKGV